VKRLERAALLLSLLESMEKQGSWCGSTHLQKACYFLQELLGVPLEFEFILYKHGPYSFDLTDELTGLRADSILTLRMRRAGYGPSYAGGELRKLVMQRFPKTLARYRSQVEFVSSRLGDKGVADLERLATALYVRKEMGDADDTDTQVSRIVELKSHVSRSEAVQAVSTVNEICREVMENEKLKRLPNTKCQ